MEDRRLVTAQRKADDDKARQAEVEQRKKEEADKRKREREEVTATIKAGKKKVHT